MTKISLTLAAATLASSWADEPKAPLPLTNKKFDPSLAKIDNIESAEKYIRKTLSPNANQAQTADAIDRFMQRRFVHDISFVKRKSNWIAWLSGKLIWPNLAFATTPDDLLKTRRGICSQQTMLFQALLARFGIEYATVGFGSPPHMLVGAKVEGRWAVYDSDEQPNRNRTVYYSEMSNPKVMQSLYGGVTAGFARPPRVDLGVQRAEGARKGLYVIKWIETNPAPHATFFDNVTSKISCFGWLYASVVTVLIWASLIIF